MEKDIELIEAELQDPEKQQESVESQSIKASFLDELITSLKIKQNKVEVRGIFRAQLNVIINMLKVKDNKAKSYYHYRSLYTVSDTKPPQLIAIPK